MNRDKLIELLKCAWDNGHNSYHDCKKVWEYEKDWKNFLDDYGNEITELLTTEDDTSENTLPIDSVMVWNTIYNLPNEERDVLIKTTDGYTGIGWYFPDSKTWGFEVDMVEGDHTGIVEYWMEIPS
jgi:hypothetical protein